MRQFYRTFPIHQTLSSELSWSYYNLLMRIEDEKSRQFYTNECIKSNWSVRQLKRQIGTFYYERLLVSQDKEAVEKEIGLPEKVEPKNIIRDPYVLEFLGLEGKTSFYEKYLKGGNDSIQFKKESHRYTGYIFSKKYEMIILSNLQAEEYKKFEKIKKIER